MTLATRVREQGMAVRFVCRPYRGNMIGALQEWGHDIVALPLEGRDDVPYTEWQDPEWNRDADQTIAAAMNGSRSLEWLIVDSYALGAQWESRLRAIAPRIMVIDDLANRAHDCDVLLDQNLHRDLDVRYDGLVPARCRRLLGPQYALLRREFAEARAGMRARDGAVRRILIFFGGSDASNETAKALKAVEMLDDNGLAVDVILGATAPHLEAVRGSCAALPRARLHCDPDNIAQLMGSADLSIGAAGSTTWERCCLGLPSVLISLAMNQESIAEGLADRGLAVYLGRRETVTPERLAAALRDLIRNPERLARLASACAGLVDGDGATRTAVALGAPGAG